MPHTAVALQAMMQSRDCQEPPGQHGVSKVLRFRIMAPNGRPITQSVRVSERFSRLVGPDQLYRLLRPNTYMTDSRGFFNDCYRLFHPRGLPSDLRLKVEQNHLLGSEVISKNHITYTATSILVCVFRRQHRGDQFEARCKNF